MRLEGTVVAINRDAVWVETTHQTACGSCSAQPGCGTSVLAKLFPDRQQFLRVLVDPDLHQECIIGQRVTVEMSDNLIVNFSLLMYLLPVVLLLLGSVLGQQLGASDGYAMIGAGVGLTAGLLVVRLHSWWHQDNAKFQPVLVATNPAVMGQQVLDLQ